MVYDGGLCEHDIEYIPIIWKHLFFAPKIVIINSKTTKCMKMCGTPIWRPQMKGQCQGGHG
jgi:hypothetical protein